MPETCQSKYKYPKDMFAISKMFGRLLLLFIGTWLFIEQVTKYVSRSKYGKQNNVFVLESDSALIGERY